MAYRIEYEPAASRAVERAEHQMARRLLEKIESLADNPRPPGSVKLTGLQAYRVRVGDYRIIYEIYDGELIVLVIDVGHRREVYRR